MFIAIPTVRDENLSRNVTKKSILTDLSAKLVRAQSQEEKTKLLERIDHILGKLRLYRQVTLRLGELIQNLRRHGTNLAFEYREGTDG